MPKIIFLNIFVILKLMFYTNDYVLYTIKMK